MPARLGGGDALGGPLEFLSAEQIAQRHGGPVRELVGGGWLDLRPGQVTDDTDMALALARSLVESGAYDPAVAMQHYLAWFDSDPPDVGNTIAGVLREVKTGVPATEAALRVHESSGGRSAGNGSLMRCAPLALRYMNDPMALIDATRADSGLTHHDPLAAESCVLLCVLVAARIAGHDVLEAPVSDERVIDALNSDSDDAARRAGEQIGFVLTAFSVARCAEKTAESFEEGLGWAVNLGGDADTNGAVAGALLGAHFGASAIPSRWLDALEPGSELVELADRLTAAASA